MIVFERVKSWCRRRARSLAFRLLLAGAVAGPTWIPADLDHGRKAAAGTPHKVQDPGAPARDDLTSTQRSPWSHAGIIVSIGSLLALLTALLWRSGSRRRIQRLRDRIREAQVSLKVAEGENRMLGRALPVGLFAVDEQGTIQHVSDEWSQLVGLPESTVRGRRWTTFFVGDGFDLHASWQAATASAAPREWKIRRSSLPERWLQVRMVPTHQEQNGRGRFLGTLIDITRTCQDEENLKRRTAQQAAIADFARQALVRRPLDELLQSMVQTIVQTTTLCHAVVLRADRGDFAMDAEHFGGDIEPIDLNTLPMCLDLARTALNLDGTRQPWHIHEDLDGQGQGAIAVPIHGRHEPFGVILALARGAAILDDEHGQFLRSLAGILGGAIARSVAEAELARSEAFRSSSERHGRVGIVEWDVHADRMICSDEVYRMIGVDPEQHRGTRFEDHLQGVHPAERSYIREQIWRTITFCSPLDVEFSGRRLDGTEMHLSLAGHFIQDHDGARLVATLLNITERVLERRLRGQLMSALEAAGEAVLISRGDGIVEYVNNAYASMTGHPQTITVGQHLARCQCWETSGTKLQGILEQVHAGHVWRGALNPSRADGCTLVAQATFVPVFGPGGSLQNIVTVLRDVTRERELEQRLRHAQKVEALGRVAGGLAHDFNNLLGIIEINCDMLREHTKGHAKMQRYMERIDRARTSATELTRQLLVFGGRQHFQPVLVDLAEVVTQTIQMLTPSLGGAVQVELAVEPDLPPILADRLMISRVLINLCVNAKDAMPDGGTLSIKAETIDDQVRISVTDSGCGIPSEFLDRVFEPFFTTKPVGRGTGLGLCTVHGIVTQHGGTIRVRSREKEGTCFEILLPSERPRTSVPPLPTEQGSTAEKRHAGPVTAAARARTTTGLTILVADDDEDANHSLANLLREGGATVIQVFDGSEAVARITSGLLVDLVILDLSMPEMGGVLAYERIHALHKDLPVIFCSASAQGLVSQELMDMPFLEKPFGTARTLETVLKVIGQDLGDPSGPGPSVSGN